MHRKEQEATAFIGMMVKHQKAVITSNPIFAETVSSAIWEFECIEDITDYYNAMSGHAAIL